MPTVLIYWSPGRSQQQKADVIHEITEALVTHGAARREDVLIIFQDIQPGDAGRAGKVLTPPVLHDSSVNGELPGTEPADPLRKKR